MDTIRTLVSTSLDASFSFSLTLPFLLLLSWLALVRAFRWRRYNYIHRKYGYKYDAGTLTTEDAQEIVNLVYQDMPMAIDYSISVGLFKTFAIPSISKILWRSKEFCTPQTVSKRFADSSILIHTWIACPISGRSVNQERNIAEKGPLSSVAEDPRANLAIARVNWLHSHYPIKNGDHLFSLAFCIIESITWAAKFGWRELSPLEQQALYIFWVDIGNRMGIQDIPDSLEAFEEWALDYEDAYMVPAQTNHEVGKRTAEELVSIVPQPFGLRNLARRFAYASLGDKVCFAMMLPQQPWYIHTLLNVSLKCIAWQVRYLHLPRWEYYGYVEPELPSFNKDEEPLMTPMYFPVKPWYKPLPKHDVERVMNGVLVKMGIYDEMPSEKLRSRGYRLDTLGPLRLEKAGQKEVVSGAEKLMGCPITGAWARPAEDPGAA